MLSRRQRIVLIVVGIVIGGGIVLAASFTDPIPQSGSVAYEANSGATVHVVGTTNASSGSPFPDDNTVHVNTTAGNLSYSSPGAVNGTVNTTDITGTWTTVSNLDVTSANLTINPEDKQPITVKGDLDRIEFREMQLDDGQADFVYKGSSGSNTIVVYGLQPNTDIRAINESGAVVAIDTTDGNGKAVLKGLSNSEHTVTLKTGTAPPELSDPRPDGNVSSQPSEFSVFVENDDFPGDNVTLKWYYKGSKFNTTHVTSEGRTSVPAPTVDVGLSEWSVIAEDLHGNKDVINATVGTPGTLYIRNVSNTSELVDSPVDVTVAFKNGTTVTQRTVSDGTVDMTGLPTEDFIVTVNASSDYHQRVVYFESIVGNSSVYLLNKTYPSVQSRFRLSDPTGQYPSTSFLIIKRAINVSGTRVYKTVYSDRFGLEGVTADLRQDERYLITIRNPDGVVQQIGPYRAEVSEEVTVQPGSPSIAIDDYQEGWGYAASLSNRTLEWRYSDPENETQQVTVFIHRKGNESVQLQPNVTYYDVGNVSGTYTLSESEKNKTWVVTFIVERGSGEQRVTREVSNRPELLPEMSEGWRLAVGILVLFISAAVFSMVNVGVGAMITAMEGGVLWYIGWLDGATSGTLVTIALFVGVLANAYTSQRV